jgi:hypothetical protein
MPLGVLHGEVELPLPGLPDHVPPTALVGGPPGAQSTEAIDESRSDSTHLGRLPVPVLPLSEAGTRMAERSREPFKAGTPFQSALREGVPEGVERASYRFVVLRVELGDPRSGQRLIEVPIQCGGSHEAVFPASREY